MLLVHILGYSTLAAQFIGCAALECYLWRVRTPIAASVHRMRIPKLDVPVELGGYDSDVGSV